MAKLQQFTICITMENPTNENNRWIWNAMQNGEEVHGVKVVGISDGNALKRESALEELVDLYNENLSISHDFNKEDQIKKNEIEHDLKFYSERYIEVKDETVV